MGVSHCEDLSFYWHIPFRWNNKQHCSILSSLLGFSMAQFSIISRAWTTKMNEIYAKKLKLLRKVTKTIMNTSCRYLWSIKWQRNCSYYRGQGNKSHYSKHSNESPPWYNYGAFCLIVSWKLKPVVNKAINRWNRKENHQNQCNFIENKFSKFLSSAKQLVHMRRYNCKDTLYSCSTGYPDCTNLRHCLPSNSCMIRLKTKVKKFDSLPCKDINT